MDRAHSWFRSTGLAAVALGVLALPANASAQTPELPVEVQILEMVNLPGESPRLTLKASDRVSQLRLTVREGSRSVLSKSVGSLGPGGERTFRWRAEPGEHNYVVEVAGRAAAGTNRTAVEAVVTVMRPLEVRLEKNQVDLEERMLFFSINNPAGRAVLTIRNALGSELHEVNADFSRRAPNTRLEVRWPALDEPIAKMELRVYDASDSWSAFELLPFTVEIPHEDVVFETAKWDIRSSEEPKLDAAHDAILEAIAEHGADLKARLYILGHTDTVGSPADNMLLSRRRAESIASYFHRRGRITVLVLAQGFGESRLLVKTADSVDEAKNRRAQYILAAQAPVATDWISIGAK